MKCPPRRRVGNAEGCGSDPRAVPGRGMERVMKIQEVILKAMAGKLKWGEAAEIIGVTDRTIRRWREQYLEHDIAVCGGRNCADEAQSILDTNSGSFATHKPGMPGRTQCSSVGVKHRSDF